MGGVIHITMPENKSIMGRDERRQCKNAMALINRRHITGMYN